MIATMRTVTRTVMVFAIFLCLSGGTGAQQRDNVGAASPTGTARISGIVVTDDNGPKPVRRSIVSLSGGGLPLGRSAITDDAGQLEFAELPPGRFAISATRQG